MAELLLVGVTHYPPLAWRDEDMAGHPADDPRGPRHPGRGQGPGRLAGADAGRVGRRRGPLVGGRPSGRAAWPASSRAPGRARGVRPRRRCSSGATTSTRTSARTSSRRTPCWPTTTSRPSRGRASPWPNVWGEDQVTTPQGQGPSRRRPLAGRRSCSSDGIDVAYAYQPLHHPSLAHAFLNTVLFLDYHRVGFPWPMVCMPINCYGSQGDLGPGCLRAVRPGARARPAGAVPAAADGRRRRRGPPPRPPARGGSRSWPRRRGRTPSSPTTPGGCAPTPPPTGGSYDALVDGDFATWEATTLAQIEHAGQQELLNWFALMGAARELGPARRAWPTFVETWCFNSNKVFALWS